jgi:hypothetical protein
MVGVLHFQGCFAAPLFSIFNFIVLLLAASMCGATAGSAAAATCHVLLVLPQFR